MEDIWEYAFNAQERLRQICSSLEKLGYRFVYDKIFNDGSAIVLVSYGSTFFKFCKTLRSHDFFAPYFNTHLLIEILSTPKEHLGKYFWPTSLLNGKELEFLHEHNIQGGISFFRRTDRYIEIWGFASRAKHDQLDLLLFNHLDYFKQFILYFNQHTKDIREPDSMKISHIRITRAMMDCLLEFQNQQKKAYLQEGLMKHYNINLSSNESISLSKREIDCLYYLSLGMYAKEISRELGLSNRTVESHINNIKKKSNRHSRSQLVSMFLNSDAKLLFDY